MRHYLAGAEKQNQNSAPASPSPSSSPNENGDADAEGAVNANSMSTSTAAANANDNANVDVNTNFGSGVGALVHDGSGVHNHDDDDNNSNSAASKPTHHSINNYVRTDSGPGIAPDVSSLDHHQFDRRGEYHDSNDSKKASDVSATESLETDTPTVVEGTQNTTLSPASKTQTTAAATRTDDDDNNIANKNHNGDTHDGKLNIDETVGKGKNNRNDTDIVKNRSSNAHPNRSAADDEDGNKLSDRAKDQDENECDHENDESVDVITLQRTPSGNALVDFLALEPHLPRSKSFDSAASGSMDFDMLFPDEELNQTESIMNGSGGGGWDGDGAPNATADLSSVGLHRVLSAKSSHTSMGSHELSVSLDLDSMPLSPPVLVSESHTPQPRVHGATPGLAEAAQDEITRASARSDAKSIAVPSFIKGVELLRRGSESEDSQRRVARTQDQDRRDFDHVPRHSTSSEDTGTTAATTDAETDVFRNGNPGSVTVPGATVGASTAGTTGAGDAVTRIAGGGVAGGVDAGEESDETSGTDDEVAAEIRRLRLGPRKMYHSNHITDHRPTNVHEHSHINNSNGTSSSYHANRRRNKHSQGQGINNGSHNDLNHSHTRSTESQTKGRISRSGSSGSSSTSGEPGVIHGGIGTGSSTSGQHKSRSRLRSASSGSCTVPVPIAGGHPMTGLGLNESSDSASSNSIPVATLPIETLVGVWRRRPCPDNKMRQLLKGMRFPDSVQRLLEYVRT